MFGPDPLKVPRRFVDCVNARDLKSLRALIGEQCRIIDPRGEWMEGRETCLEALERLFDLEPEYRIHVASMGRAGDNVLINGHTTASDPRFVGTTLWRAKADRTHVHEWQGYSARPGARMCRLLVGDKAQMGPFLEGAY